MFADEITKESRLDRWFKEKWVDISKKDKSGKYKPCGRSDSSKGGYPKCRPSKRVNDKTPATTKELSDSEEKAAIRKKRKIEKNTPDQSAGGNSRKPKRAPTIKKSRADYLQSLLKIASPNYVETLFEESPDSPDYFDSMQKLLLKSDNKNIIFYIDDELGEGVEAKVFRGYFKGKEVAIKFYSKSGSVDKYRKLLAIKDSLPNNWARYIPTIYFMEKNITGKLFSVAEDLIDPSLINLIPSKLTNYIDEIIIMELNKQAENPMGSYGRDFTDKGVDSEELIKHLIESIYNRNFDYIKSYNQVKKVTFDKEKIYKDLYNSNLSFSYLENNKIAEIFAKNIKIYFENNDFTLYDLVFNLFDVENKFIDFNFKTKEEILEVCKYFYQNIATNVYFYMEDFSNLGYIDHDSVKKYFQKATYRGYSDFVDFLDYLKENYGIIASDLHSDNIMLNPKTNEYQLIDVGYFKFEDNDE